MSPKRVVVQAPKHRLTIRSLSLSLGLGIPPLSDVAVLHHRACPTISFLGVMVVRRRRREILAAEIEIGLVEAKRELALVRQDEKNVELLWSLEGGHALRRWRREAWQQP